MSRKRSSTQSRSAARLAAVQALYEMDMAGASTDAILAEFITDRWTAIGPELPSTPDRALLVDLVEGVAARIGELDVAIGDALADAWTVDRLEAVLRAILRAGVYELTCMPNVPQKVVINEYVDLAHAFYSGKEPGLVNAVLDHIGHHVRAGAALPDDQDDARTNG